MALAAAVVAIVFSAAVGAGVRLDTTLLSSGVYRTGEISGAKDRDVVFHRDGRTATVTAIASGVALVVAASERAEALLPTRARWAVPSSPSPAMPWSKV